MSNDTFAANKAEINALSRQVTALDAARAKRQKVLKQISKAEAQAMNAIAQSAATSEGSQSAARINEALRPGAKPTQQPKQKHQPLQGIPVMRMVGSRFETTDMEPVPFSAIAIASAKRTPHPSLAANQAQASAGGWNRPTCKHPHGTSSSTSRKQLAADQAQASDRKAAWFVAIVMVACIVSIIAISQLAKHA